VPAETIVAYVGEVGTVTGSGFTPDTEVTVDITVNGVPFVTFPLMTDASGGFTFGGPIPPEEVGALVLTVTEANVCSDTITATILAATPAPTPEGLPDAAMAPPSSGSDLPVVLGVLLLGLLCLAAASLGREGAPS
jgi:hypothetical protein